MVSSSPSTASGDLGWVWPWCCSTDGPGGGTQCQTQSHNQCTVECCEKERAVEREKVVGDDKGHKCLQINWRIVQVRLILNAEHKPVWIWRSGTIQHPCCWSELRWLCFQLWLQFRLSTLLQCENDNLAHKAPPVCFTVGFLDASKVLFKLFANFHSHTWREQVQKKTMVRWQVDNK